MSKAAFLQGKTIERDVFINPPEEFKEDNIAWRLKTCDYELNDASRTWYLRVREEFIKLGAQPSPYDPVLFYWHSNNLLNGLLSIHVDNISWRGTSSFQNIIIDPLKETFESSKESCSMFKYLGLFIQRKEDCNAKQLIRMTALNHWIL